MHPVDEPLLLVLREVVETGLLAQSVLPLLRRKVLMLVHPFRQMTRLRWTAGELRRVKVGLRLWLWLRTHLLPGCRRLWPWLLSGRRRRPWSLWMGRLPAMVLSGKSW
jgi:hypothetical protein